MNNYKETLNSLKTTDEKHAFLNSIDFNITIKIDKDVITLLMPNLNISAIGTKVTELYEEIREEKEAYFQEMLETDSEDEICFPPQTKPAGLKEVFNVFIKLVTLYKSIIILVLFILITFKSCSSISESVIKSQHRLKEKIEENLTNVTPEKTQRRKMKIGRFLNFVKPYYIQLKVFEKSSELEATHLLKNTKKESI